LPTIARPNNFRFEIDDFRLIFLEAVALLTPFQSDGLKLSAGRQ
jgi:hypothetical protein